jgi:F0F1-type ATP synthase assembly protein I
VEPAGGGSTEASAEAKKSSPVGLVMLLTPLIVAPFVLGGVYLGFYLGDLWGYSKSILAIVFSTAGFLAAVAIVSKVITKVVARSSSR